MESYVGMRFDSLQVAYEHYNSYALRLGFAIKMNTSRWAPYTNELVKQQFCCNKYKKPKVDDGGAETAPILDPLPDPKAVVGDEEMEEEPPIFIEEETDPKKRKKKRKRETIRQTGCKAKMLVKLKDGRWEVTHFVRDHKHPLVNKPSLSKYLISHQGISADEKEFLRILYNRNLTTVGADVFELRPNQEFVAKYGSRNYLVQAKVDEGSYLCECYKMDKQGMLCCHILKVFNHLGVDVIPERYMLRRWTPTAVPSAPGTGYESPHEMPPQSNKQIRQRNMMMDFQKLSKFASDSDAAHAIIYKHMCGARTEMSHLNKSKKKKKLATPMGPSDDANPRGAPPPPGPTQHAPPPPPPLGQTSSAPPPPPNGPTGSAQGHHHAGTSHYQPTAFTGRAPAGFLFNLTCTLHPLSCAT